MPTNESNFEALEKQLAKDALNKTLKDLHGEIHKEIENNKKAFSEEIQKTLSSFKENLEQNVSDSIDKKLSSLFTEHFQNISLQVKTNFHETFSPVLVRTKEDMQRLHDQGENTLRSWGDMMKQYTGLWTKPFVIVFLASSFVGALIFFGSAYFLWSKHHETLQLYERRLSSNEDMLQWYFEKYKESAPDAEKGKQSQSRQPKNKAKKK